MPSTDADDNLTINEDSSSGPSKRRKLRKGTHSCWECKRRKMKCIFPTSGNITVCIACQRRPTLCVTQDVSEEEAHLYRRAPTQHGLDSGSTERAPTIQDAPPAANGGINETSNAHLAFFEAGLTRASSTSNKYERLSAFLHAAIPSFDEVKKICGASRHPALLPHEVMTMPYTQIDETGSVRVPFDLLKIPQPTEHPVLVARYMLLLASVVPHLHPDEQHKLQGMSESPRVIGERLAHLATSLVTTNDALVGSIEGLQCVVTEAVYQTSKGNLRRSWMACRRAITIAQLMGLDRSADRAQFQVLQPDVQYDPQMLWCRILCLDRLLCLMLGLSQGSLDRSMTSEALMAGDTDLGRLERMHCVIASRILERNESHSGMQDNALTDILDRELQNAAKSMPTKFWLVPTLKLTSAPPSSLFWETRQIFAQVLHFNLLNQLHLPYMLRSPSLELRNEYSRITCIDASREIIQRFITLHSINGFVYACRIIDFLTLMAAMTLALAHLHSRCVGNANLLAHQRYSDRAIIERVQDIMEEVNRVNADPLSAKSADLLRRLLVIEADTVGDVPFDKRTVSVTGSDVSATPPRVSDHNAVSVHIPYFGIITVKREGISKEAAKPYTAMIRAPAQSQKANQSSAAYDDFVGSASAKQRSHAINSADTLRAMLPLDADTVIANARTEMSGDRMLLVHPLAETDGDQGAIPSTPFDPLWQYSDYPGLAAEGEDWAFQGMDSAFFDRLMSAFDTGSNPS